MRAPAASRTESFAALGTTIVVATRPHEPEASALAQQVVADVDRECSRFRSDSDLSRINANPGRWVAAGPVLVAALRIALEAADATDGLVSPCLGRSLRSVGYDADLAAVRDRSDATAVSHLVPRIDAWRDVEVDQDGAVRIPGDIELDLGATGKAFCADLVALTIQDRFGVDVAVSAGGDVRIVNETGDPWPIEISEGPESPADSTVAMVDGGIATSSTTGRRWTRDGIVYHHLLDPRTGLPSSGPWRTVTASGPTCAAANVAATASIVLGERAVEWLEDRGVWARLVDQDGGVTIVGTTEEATL